MKKIIKSISFLILLFTVNLSFASAFISITEMQVNGVPIDNYGTIPFGSNTSVNLYFKLSINKSGSVSDFSTFYLYLRKDASTTPLLLDGIMVNNSAFDSQGHWYGYFSKTIYASDIANSGSCLYGKYQDDTTNPSSPIVYDTTDCYSLSKIAPSFTLSPAPLYLYCGDTGPYTFTVTASNIPTGATVSYSWSYSGWSGNPSTTNSITLSTTTGYNLPGWVYVTPYINNVAQPQLSCQITRATQLTGAAITGPTGVCSGSANYTISNLNVASGEIVFNWFLTDSATSNSGYASGPIASLSNQSNTGVTVTFNSGNTALYIKAIVKNLCGQNVIKSFQIRDGAAIFTSAATMTGNTSGICNPGDQKTFNINNLQPTETLQWSISDTDIASLSVSADGLQATVTATGSGSGSQTVTANITNTCGQICTKNKTFYIGTPTFNKFTYGCTNRSLCIASDANYAFTSPTILNTKNRVIANFFGLTATEAANSANWQWQEAPGNHLLYINTISPKNYLDLCPIAAGTTILQVRAKNNTCPDFSEWVDLPITIAQLPSSGSFRLSQSPGVVSLREDAANNIITTQYNWASNNIWVRNTQDGIMEHQNPVYNENAPNYVYVRIANTGCTTTGPRTLKTYWSKASTSLNWPNTWNGATYNSGDTKLGDIIGAVDIPELQPEQQTVVSMPFIVPNPDKYENIVDEPWRFGLLARVDPESDENESTETEDLIQNIINNESLALNNVTVVDCTNDNLDEQTIGGVIAVGNTFNTTKSFYLELVKEDLETGKPIYDEAEVSLKLDETLYQAWVRGGKTAERIENTIDDKIKLVKDNNVFLKDIELNAHETGTLYLKFNFLTKEITDKTKYVYHVIQRETGTNKIIGGETYVIRKQDRPLFSADAGGTKYVDKNEPITISASQISEPAVYNWYDSEGNLVCTGKDLSIATDVAQKFKLEVITTDGFKDYSEVEVKLNPNSLGTISPNPASNNAIISYKINEASSAYLMILGGYGTIGDSNNYILGINGSEINIDLSYYSSGFYTVALICDGQIVDAKTLVKE